MKTNNTRITLREKMETIIRNPLLLCNLSDTNTGQQRSFSYLLTPSLWSLRRKRHTSVAASIWESSISPTSDLSSKTVSHLMMKTSLISKMPVHLPSNCILSLMALWRKKLDLWARRKRYRCLAWDPAFRLQLCKEVVWCQNGTTNSFCCWRIGLVIRHNWELRRSMRIRLYAQPQMWPYLTQMEQLWMQNSRL